MAVSFVDEALFHSILDRGLLQLKRADYPQQTLAFPLKSFSRSSPAYREAASLGLENEVTILVNTEIASLKARLAALETSTKRPSTSLAYTQPERSHKPLKESNLSLRSVLKNSTIDYFLKDIERSEKEISRIQIGLNQSKPKVEAKHENEQVALDLIVLRRQNFELNREREALTKKVSYKTDYLARYMSMQEDFQSLRQSYEKSEAIREKQREFIEQLKGELKTLVETDMLPKKKKPLTRRPVDKKFVRM